MLEANHTAAAPALTNYREAERRRHARLKDAFPARVQGVNVAGDAFDVEVRIDDVSAGGLHMRLPHCVPAGAKLSTTVRFTAGKVARSRAKCLAVHATVRRTTCHADGTCEVGVEFEHHLFL